MMLPCEILQVATNYSRSGQKSYSIIFFLVPVRKTISLQEIYSDNLFLVYLLYSANSKNVSFFSVNVALKLYILSMFCFVFLQNKL